MKITDPNQQRNPDQISQQLTELVDQLKLNVKTAAKLGNTFDRVERSILTSVLKIGEQAVELLLALQGGGDLGEKIQNSDGRASLRSQTKAATGLRSIFGEHSFEQFTYAQGKSR